MSQRSVPLPDLDGAFATLLIDCPWKYKNFSEKKHGAAASNYETVPTEDIIAYQCGRYGSKNSVLGLWATWPKLPDAIDVMDAWGYEYVTAAPWVKTHPPRADIATGIGFWWQSASEVLMIGRRGKLASKRFPIIAYLTEDEPRMFYCPSTRKHSQKPTSLHAWFEEKAPGPRMELFATRQTEGWGCYGLSLGHRIAPEGIFSVTPVLNK